MSVCASVYVCMYDGACVFMYVCMCVCVCLHECKVFMWCEDFKIVVAGGMCECVCVCVCACMYMSAKGSCSFQGSCSFRTPNFCW